MWIVRRLVLYVLAFSSVFVWEPRPQNPVLYSWHYRKPAALLLYLKEGGATIVKKYRRGGWESKGIGVQIRTGVFTIRPYFVTGEHHITLD